MSEIQTTRRRRGGISKMRSPDYAQGYRAGYSAGRAHGVELLIMRAETELAAVREHLQRQRAELGAIEAKIVETETRIAETEAELENAQR